MKNLLIILSLFFAVLCLCGKSAIAQKIDVSGAIEQQILKRGKPANGRIIINIPKELHINSHKPKDEFLVPTKVKFASSNIKAGKIIYPPGKFQKFDFSEESLSVYEGQISIKFTFTVPANFKSKEVTINVVVQYQACNQEVCFPPKKERITLAAKIK